MSDEVIDLSKGTVKFGLNQTEEAFIPVIKFKDKNGLEFDFVALIEFEDAEEAERFLRAIVDIFQSLDNKKNEILQ